mgnify:CR=1 FL=1
MADKLFLDSINQAGTNYKTNVFYSTEFKAPIARTPVDTNSQNDIITLLTGGDDGYNASSSGKRSLAKVYVKDNSNNKVLASVSVSISNSDIRAAISLPSGYSSSTVKGVNGKIEISYRMYYPSGSEVYSLTLYVSDLFKENRTFPSTLTENVSKSGYTLVDASLSDNQLYLLKAWGGNNPSFNTIQKSCRAAFCIKEVA